MNNAIDRLKKLANEAKAIKYKNAPAHAVPKATYSEKDANALTKCVLDWINYHSGCLAYRVNNTGIFDPIKRTFRQSNTRKGIADISAIVKGRAWQIEIKHGKDRQSEEQKRFQADVEAAGGVYLIVRSFAAFLGWWDFITGPEINLPPME